LWKACKNTHHLNMTKANKFLLPALAAGIGLILAAQASAQTFTTLYSFTGGSDGGTPFDRLVLSGNTLYGTADVGGSSGYGTVFAVNTDGTGFTNLYSFTGGSDGALGINGDLPWAGLILSGNTLYGTALGGGIFPGNGTVFAVNTDGTGFRTLYSFTGNSDGGEPYTGLILSGNTLYGTAVNSSTASGDGGTVFAVNTNGTGFRTLHDFTGGSDGDGAQGVLVLSGNTLYGTAGTVFAVNTNGAGFRTLYDGGGADAGVILSGNTLYGTTGAGPLTGNGTVFAVDTNGTGLRTLYKFTGGSDGYLYGQGALILSGNTLYGTASWGGSFGFGTVFAVNTNGTGFTVLHSFTAPSDGFLGGTNSDGTGPEAGLILSGNTLYGTASGGGSSGYGTVFSLSLPTAPPQLNIIPSAGSVILTWPTNYAGFTLQSTTNLGSLAFWTTNSSAPVVVNGQNVVTNPLSGAHQFFRLSQ
jgi:uncharacterized repeat protein (TIGR03803 family)